MIISHAHRYVFIKTRKTAGTSIEISLSRSAGPEDVLTPISPKDEKIREELGIRPRGYHGFFNPFPELLFGSPREKIHAFRDFVHQRRYRNHMPGPMVRRRLGARTFDSYFRFCFERNPWDKTVSHYFWNRERRGRSELTFTEYMQRADFPVDHHRYFMKGRMIVDFIGRFECLDEDLKTAAGLAGMPFDGWLPRAKSGVRTAASRDYRTFYNDETRRVIERAFATEIGLFGYRFEDPKPEHAVVRAAPTR